MRAAKLLSSLFVLGLAVGCTGSRPPAADPPPSLAHIGDVQLKSTMWRVARETGALREILQTSSPPGAEERAAARGLLDDIALSLELLANDPLTSPHPMLQAGLPAFRDDVRRAREAVDLEPPNFEPAIRLASSCQRCHVVARAPTPLRPGRLAWR